VDVALSDEQELWRSTVARLADELAMHAPDDASADADVAGRWARVVALGLPALRSPAMSGLDETGVEVALAAEEFGRALVPLPLVGPGIVVPDLLAAAGADTVLERVAAGELHLAPVLDAGLRSFARRGDAGVAWDAAGATHGLVIEARDTGRALVAVPLDPGRRAGLDITRRHVPVDASTAPADIGDLGGPISPARWHRAEALALTALAADLVGIMAGALDDAVAHVCERRQFGVPVGSFQAVQHLAADCLVQLEGARSCVWHAAWAVDAADVDDAVLAARTAKAYASRAGREVVEATIQMFGGVAITWEYLAHVRIRRALVDRQVFGDETVHYAAIAESRLAAAVRA